MTLADMVNQEGKDSRGTDRTPLIIAAAHGHFHLLKYLIEQGEADPNIARSNGDTPLMVAVKNTHFRTVQYLIEQCNVDPNIAVTTGIIGNGRNALHHAVANNGTNTDLIQFLINHMTMHSINKENGYDATPLDVCYAENHGPMRQEIIALLRSKGGIANKYDLNGNYNWVDAESESLSSESDRFDEDDYDDDYDDDYGDYRDYISFASKARREEREARK